MTDRQPINRWTDRQVIEGVQAGPRCRFGEFIVVKNVILGADVVIWHHVNLYGCELGDDVMVGTFVEIQDGAKVDSGSRIQSHSFIPSGVTIGKNVFVGHNVVFINDNYPRTETSKDHSWDLLPVVVEDGASIGSHVTILGGVTIGAGAMVGAGAIVAENVAPGVTVKGEKARLLDKGFR